MARGHPDWGATAPVETIAPVLDLGELAARLGSVVTFDRRGNVVWIDGFEDGIAKWEKLGTGTGAALASGTERVRFQAKSLQMTAGSDSEVDVTAVHHLFILKPKRLGLEASFTIGAYTAYLEFMLEYWDGAHFHHGLVSYRNDLERIQYLDNNNTQQVLASGVEFYATTWRFNTIKMVIDLETDRYVRCILNDTEYDMSTLELYHPVNTDPKDMKALIIHHGTAGQNAVCYIDDVIVTQNEP